MQVPEYKVSTLFSGTKVGTGSLCVHSFLFSLLSSCFKMASDRAKWSNYVDSLISGTQSVNTTPFCAGTQYQVWTHSPLEMEGLSDQLMRLYYVMLT